MSFTVGGHSVYELRVTIPRQGCWYGTLVADQETGTELEGALSLSIPGLGLQAYAVRSAPVNGFQHVRFVGGFTGGYAKTLTPQGYQQATYRQIATDLLTQVGESLSPTSDATALAAVAPQWVRMAESASAQLDLLTAAMGNVWRVLPDGTCWIGTDAWAVAPDVDFALLEFEPSERKAVYGVGAFSVLPGLSFDGVRVSQVEHCATEEYMRTTVWSE